MGGKAVQLFIRATSLLEMASLPLIKLLLHLLHVSDGVADKVLLQVIQSVVHAVVEGLDKKRGEQKIRSEITGES